MSLFTAIVHALVTILLIALAYYLIIWVFGVIGFVLPAVVMHILLAILVLLAILYIIRVLWPHIANSSLWPK